MSQEQEIEPSNRVAALARKCRWEPNALVILEDTTYKEWVEIGRSLCFLANSIRWAVGDWIRFGEAHYGEKYSQALETTHLSYDSLRQSVWVASRFDPERRREELSWSHHLLVASLPAPKQEELLNKAEAEGLSRQALSELVKQEKVEVVYTVTQVEKVSSQCPGCPGKGWRPEKWDALLVINEEGAWKVLSGLSKDDYPRMLMELGADTILEALSEWRAKETSTKAR